MKGMFSTFLQASYKKGWRLSNETQIYIQQLFDQLLLIIYESNCNIINQLPPVTVGQQTTMDQLKEQINLIIGVPYDQIHLFYQNEKMENSRYVMSMGMEDGDFFHVLTDIQENLITDKISDHSSLTKLVEPLNQDSLMSSSKFSIQGRFSTSDRLTFHNITGNETVEQLKFLIAERTNLKIDQIYLFFEGQEMLDKNFLSSYHIEQDGDVFQIYTCQLQNGLEIKK